MSILPRWPLIERSDLLVSPGEPRSAFLKRTVLTMATWRERVRIRRSLAQMDARSLRDAGISPAAAAFESGQPFWRKMGGLR